MSQILRLLNTVYIPSGRIGVGTHKIYTISQQPRIFAHVFTGICPSLKCMPGIWRILKCHSPLLATEPGSLYKPMSSDDILMIHDNLYPTEFDFNGRYKFLCSAINPNYKKIYIRDYIKGDNEGNSAMYSYPHQVSIPLAIGTWHLRGSLKNGSKIHASDYENEFFLLRNSAEIPPREVPIEKKYLVATL